MDYRLELVKLQNYCKDQINKRKESGTPIDRYLRMVYVNISIAIDEIFDREQLELPRYFVDERNGCAAVRDRHHPKYDKEYQGLHQDTPDVVVYAHGFQNHEKGCWEVKKIDIEYLKLECGRLNKSAK